MILYDALTCRNGYWRMHPLDPPEPYLDSLVELGYFTTAEKPWLDQTLIQYLITKEGLAKLESMREESAKFALFIQNKNKDKGLTK